ncbi:hypothetical protein D3C79_789950 [compost metagenome]
MAGQRLMAQVGIHRLQVRRFVQAVDQQRPLAGQPHPGEQPLPPASGGRRGNDLLWQKTGEQRVDIADS